jgi:GNAT superfamily N-acetyltransferase
LSDVRLVSSDPLVLESSGGSSVPPTHALTFTSGPAALSAPALAALTTAVGWPPRDPARLAAALGGSYYTAAVLLTPLDAAGGATPTLPTNPPPHSILVAAARATSDAAFNATIWDVLVHPAAQGRGVGAALVERVTGDLLRAGLGNVTLFSGKESVGFYEGLGYEADPEGIKGMFHVGV